MKICIDAGHYGKYNRSPVYRPYYESVMTWKLYELLRKELEAYGFQVVGTRTDQAKDLEVYQRGKLSRGCDLFLSLHSNAASGASVDYPVAIVQRNGKGDRLGLALATCVDTVMGTKQKGRIWTRANASGGEWYGVLRGAAAVGTVGIILEHSFHTNSAAAQWLYKDANLAKLAKAEAKVIADYYGIKPQTAKPQKSVEDLATEVIRGLWGVGADRKQRLTAAGFDYAAVQAAVNKRLRG
jgi:N-acetylmuramoyl-L-alanine amidase